MRKLKMLGLMLVVAGATFASSIGYVNTGEVFRKYSKSKTIQENLTKEKTRLEGQIKQKEVALQKAQVDLQGKGSTITAEEKTKFQKDVEEFQKFVKDSQIKLNKEERTRLQEIEGDINAAVAQVAKTEKMDYVLEQGAIKFGGINLTEKVLTQLESNKK